MTFTGFVTNAAGLIAMRLVLGGFEAGLFPGIIALLSFIYPRHYIQLRIGIFFSAATIAGAFGGLLAYGLARVEVDDYNGWRWIFFVEGALTVAVAGLAYWLLVYNVDEAKFLSAEDRKYMSDRLKYDGQDVVPMNNEYKRVFVVAGLKDWKTWIVSGTCWAVVCRCTRTLTLAPPPFRLWLRTLAACAQSTPLHSPFRLS